MSFQILNADITTLQVDAIVNATNASLLMGGGVSRAIFEAAGAWRLQAACYILAPIKTGEAVITPAFKLPMKYIIHTAGPVYGHHTPENAEELLRACYTNSLKIALEHNCASIAFPLISSGHYGYPRADAQRVAESAIEHFISEHEIDASLVLFK